MTRPTDEDLLGFLEGRLTQAQRQEVLRHLDEDPALAHELRQAAQGLAALDAIRSSERTPRSTARTPKRVSPWWIPAAVAASLVLAFPPWSPARTGPDTVVLPAQARPQAPEASYVLVLHGRWPDAADLDQATVRDRAAQYWSWTGDLASRGVLLAAGDLSWEPGRRVGRQGVVSASIESLDEPDFVVGMFALRVSSYEEAVSLARECPHLRFGGTVSVRRVGQGFVTVPGMDDWALAARRR